MGKGVAAIVYDHTAPWKCSLLKCKVCSKKPTYYEYMKNKGLIDEGFDEQKT